MCMLYLPILRADKYPGIQPPPIPASISLKNAAMFPKYYPSSTTMFNLTRKIRHESSQPSGISEIDHIYEQLKILSGGLDSGQVRDSAPRPGQRIEVVFWQRQRCVCRQSAGRLGAVCTNSTDCTPLLVVFNGSRVCMRT